MYNNNKVGICILTSGYMNKKFEIRALLCKVYNMFSSQGIGAKCYIISYFQRKKNVATSYLYLKEIYSITNNVINKIKLIWCVYAFMNIKIINMFDIN